MMKLDWGVGRGWVRVEVGDWVGVGVGVGWVRGEEVVGWRVEVAVGLWFASNALTDGSHCDQIWKQILVY